MFRIHLLILIFISHNLQAQQLSGDVVDTNKGMLIVHPIMHGTLALEWDNKIILIDPYGGPQAMEGIPAPDLILITDIHGDHHNPKTIASIDTEKTTFIVPQAVADKMDRKVQVLANGEETKFENIKIEAVPMYNLPESPDSRHPKGRGNGYVVTMAGARIYISGDTEDIPEMRDLKNIHVAFVCMNMPYTMEVEQAADAVLEFNPDVVYPYHYRGSEGLSDVNLFRDLVKSGNKDIDVRLLNWYPEQ